MNNVTTDNIREVDPVKAGEIARAFHSLSRTHRHRLIRQAIKGGTYDVAAKLDETADRMARGDPALRSHARLPDERAEPAPLTDGFIRDDYWPTDELM